MLDDVGHVDLRALDARGHEGPIEELAGRAHEGLAGDVLAVTGLFAQEHQLGVARPFSEHGLGLNAYRPQPWQRWTVSRRTGSESSAGMKSRAQPGALGFVGGWPRGYGMGPASLTQKFARRSMNAGAALASPRMIRRSSVQVIDGEPGSRQR